MPIQSNILSRSVFFLMVGLIYFCLPAYSQAGAWHTYSYPKDGFAVDTPSAPHYSESGQNLASATTSMHNYAVETADGYLIVMVSWFGPSMKNLDPDKALQSGRDKIARKSSVKFIEGREFPIRLGSNHGLAYEYSDVIEGYHMHYYVRAYVVGERLYQIIVSLTEGRNYSAVERFHSSFHLIPNE